jgi:hypothetical protein
LAVKCSDGTVMAPYQAKLLVQGTQKTLLVVRDTSPDARIMNSVNVKCVMSDAGGFTLRSYCHESSLLEYQLGTDQALVYVSAIVKRDGVDVLIVDSMQKIEREQHVVVRTYMTSAIIMAQCAREAVDNDRVRSLVTPESNKRANTLGRLPSDA